MDFLPYYSDLKLVGHLACAFVGAMFSGTLLFAASLFAEKGGLFERSYAFALMCSACVWAVPAFLDASPRVKEFAAYGFLAASLLALKYVFRKDARACIPYWLAFAAGQAAVYFMLYQKMI